MKSNKIGNGTKFLINIKVNGTLEEDGKKSKLDMTMELEVEELDYEHISKAVRKSFQQPSINRNHRTSKSTPVAA